MYQTGVGVYIRNLIYELSKLDKQDLKYVIFARDNEWSRFLEEYKPTTSNMEHRTCDISWHSFGEQLVFLFQLYFANLDLVHFPYFSWPVLYFKPFVATVHDTILLQFSTGKASTLNPYLYKIKQLIFNLVFAQQIFRAKTILVPTSTVRNELLKYYKYAEKKIVVTSEGVDMLFQQSEEKKPRSIAELEDYFLYVGNCYPHKNVNVLLRAFSKYRLEKRKISENYNKIIIVGPESIFAEKLQKEFAYLEDDVLWMHNVETSELKWLYKNAKALVFPSKSEGFGLPIVEAETVGCPLILSDISVFHEIADNRASFFNPYDDERLPDLLSNIPKIGSRQVSEKFTFVSMAKLVYSSYQ
ncbi:MAG: glycosyltransferase family 1 protein [Patescibacteria group bacterium]